MRIWMKGLLILATLAVVTSACARQQADPGVDEEGEAPGKSSEGELSLELRDEKDPTQRGNSLTMGMDVRGLKLVPTDGDTSGETGHLHTFVDREPVDVGAIIPKEEGIIHHGRLHALNPVKVHGLTKGKHTLTVVMGDGAHRRIGEGVEVEVTVEILGPFVNAKAPATIDEGEDLKIDLTAEGVEIKPADGDTSGETGHFHVFVDPEHQPQEGDIVPQTGPDGSVIVHTAESTVTIPDLAKGDHTIYVIVGDGEHKILDPAVMDLITVTVA